MCASTFSPFRRDFSSHRSWFDSSVINMLFLTEQDHCCILYSVIGWHSTVGCWTRVEGTPNDPNPNKPFAKLETLSMFSEDGRLNPSITVIGKLVQSHTIVFLFIFFLFSQFSFLPSVSDYLY